MINHVRDGVANLIWEVENNDEKWNKKKKWRQKIRNWEDNWRERKHTLALLARMHGKGKVEQSLLPTIWGAPREGKEEWKKSINKEEEEKREEERREGMMRGHTTPSRLLMLLVLLLFYLYLFCGVCVLLAFFFPHPFTLPLILLHPLVSPSPPFFLSSYITCY